jgi:hypothetical protein
MYAGFGAQRNLARQHALYRRDVIGITVAYMLVTSSLRFHRLQSRFHCCDADHDWTKSRVG